MQNQIINFKKSSFSGREDRCVEVAILENNILVRHSKEKHPVISFTKEEWEAFTEGVKNSEFDL